MSRTKAAVPEVVYSHPDDGTAPAVTVDPDNPTTHSEIIDLTVEDAVNLLLQNHCNRPLRRDRVQSLSRAILAGRWRYTGDPIKIATIGPDDRVFTETGEPVPPGTEVLFDGQHRVHSLLLAARTAPGTTIRVRIERGFPYPTNRAVDAGAPRSVADRWRFDHPELDADPRMMTALARRVVRYRETGSLIGRHVLANVDELMDLPEAELDKFVEAVQYATKHKTLRMPSSLVSWLYFTLSEADPEPAKWFMDKFHTGAELPEGHPIALLRDRLDKELDKARRHQRKGVSEAEMAMYAIIAWNHTYRAIRRGREHPTLQKLQATKGGMSADSFEILGSKDRFVRSSD